MSLYKNISVKLGKVFAKKMTNKDSFIKELFTIPGKQKVKLSKDELEQAKGIIELSKNRTRQELRELANNDIGLK